MSTDSPAGPVTSGATENRTTENRATDEGLLSPVTVGHDTVVSDAAFLDALVTAEVGLARARARIEGEPDDRVEALSTALGWAGVGNLCRGHGISVREIAEDSISGGNPVIPLVSRLKDRVPDPARRWLHRGATSQDIVDTALMLLARDACAEIIAALHETLRELAEFARTHRDVVCVARTLTQHAVPTTVGARAAGWLRGIRRAARNLEDARAALPAQLGGAAGTLAAFVEISGTDRAAALPAAFASELGLATPDAPWQTTRWPVTELGDALVQTIDAVGHLAADIATLARTEIGELAEGTAGGSSTMPQKQNPVGAVLLRSSALRAPQLGATLHLAAAFTVDERPDGAWHAEWQTLRELLRLALGASAHCAELTGGLRVDTEAVARNVARTSGLLVAERLSIVLGPLIGEQRVAALVAAASGGDDLATLVRAIPELGDIDAAALLDPAEYTGLSERLVDAALREENG